MAALPSPATVTAFQLYRQIIVETDDLPSVIGELATLKAMAWTRLTTMANPSPGPPAASPERDLIDVTQATAIVGQNRKWVLRHTKGKRFRHDLSRKVIKFDKPGLLRWVANKTS